MDGHPGARPRRLRAAFGPRAILPEQAGQTDRSIRGRRPDRRHGSSGRAVALVHAWQQVVVDNRPGASGAIGTRAAAAAEPDGHTLLIGSVTTLVTGPLLSKNAGYDPLKDLVPVAMLASTPFALVVASSMPPKTLQEFIAYARRNPGKLNFGTPAGTFGTPDRGVVSGQDRHRHRGHSIQGRRDRRHRHTGWAGRHDLRADLGARGAHPGRQGAAAGRHRLRCAARSFRKCRP